MYSLAGDDPDAASPDAELVRGARANPKAFTALYDRYVGRIYGYLRTRVARPEDAADLTQQVFLRALDGLGGYDERKGAFDAWLFSIARNASADAHRRRRDTVSWEEWPGAAGLRASEDTEVSALRRESLARLWGLLTELGPEKRELVWLRFVSDLTVPQIATLVGKSPAAVHKQIARALRALEEQYDER
jgi:RNA polymerase sigma-70 factor (ECF subfamily)